MVEIGAGDPWKVMADSLSDRIAYLDDRGRVVLCNRTFRDLASGEAGDPVGRKCHQVVHGTDRHIPNCPFLRMKESMMRESTELQVGDGWYDITVDPVLDEDGNLVGAVHIMSDMSGRKGVEMDVLDRLDRMSLLLDILSHDISNLVQGVVVNLEMQLFAGNMPEGPASNARYALRQALAISELVSHVDTLFDRRDQTVNGDGVDMAAVLDAAADRVRSLHAGRNIAVRRSIVPGEVVVSGGRLIHNVFNNILENAVKYDPHPDVEIDVAFEPVEGGRFWRIEVRDRGPGIPDERKEAVFGRPGVSAAAERDSGLGLSLVREVVSRSGGSVRVEDRVKGDHTRGCSFIVVLPAEKPP